MAAHPIAPSITVGEFLRAHEGDDGDHYELIDGEICERDVNGYSHDRVKNNFKELFDRSGVDREMFTCWIEHSFQMGDSSIMTPDAAIIRVERLANRTGNSATSGAPDIPIEVAISDKPSVLQRKISTYLDNGAHAVCCVYPDLRIIVIYTPGVWRQLTETDALEFPALLPGVAIPVSAIFEGV